MVEVISSTFEQHIPAIEGAIKKACFIAIDAEYTGLKVKPQYEESYFDSVSDRYKKMCTNADKFIICQLGLSIFTKPNNENRYLTHSYTFYLYPKSCGVIDDRFLVQSSAFEFLSVHGFDFNKLIYEGIPYLNEEKCKKLLGVVKEKDYLTLMRGTSIDVSMNEHMGKVADWLNAAQEGDEMTVDLGEKMKPLDKMVVLMMFRASLSGWFEDANDGKISVKKVSKAERDNLINNDNLEDKYINTLIGFSKVFRMLVDAKKPIVGHNCLTDIVLMYKQFYKSLPGTISEFKENVLELFPCIIDTKYITKKVEKFCYSEQLLRSSVLNHLYEKLKSDERKKESLLAPKITHATGFERYESSEMYHESGYDAYVSGFVFLHMAHIHGNQILSPGRDRNLDFPEILHTLRPHANKLHVMKSNFTFIDLEGADPKSRHPSYLIVECRKPGFELSVEKVTGILSGCGTVETQMLTKYRVLVTMTTPTGIRNAFTTFKENEEYRIARYDKWKHSKTYRTGLWVAFCLFSGTSVSLANKLIRSSF